MHRKMSFSVRSSNLEPMPWDFVDQCIWNENTTINFTPICFQFDQTSKQIDQIANQTKRYRIHNWIKCHFEEFVWRGWWWMHTMIGAQTQTEYWYFEEK